MSARAPWGLPAECADCRTQGSQRWSTLELRVLSQRLTAAAVAQGREKRYGDARSGWQIGTREWLKPRRTLYSRKCLARPAAALHGRWTSHQYGLSRPDGFGPWLWGLHCRSDDCWPRWPSIGSPRFRLRLRYLLLGLGSSAANHPARLVPDASREFRQRTPCRQIPSILADTFGGESEIRVESGGVNTVAVRLAPIPKTHKAKPTTINCLGPTRRA